MAVKLGHATIDENGKGYYGAAGDQTGKEVRTLNWYAGGWHTVFRPIDAAVAEKSAAACEAACASAHIGYDQASPDRNTLYREAVKVNFALDKITSDCECDCSSLMHVCAIAGGAPIDYGSNAFTTRTMAARLTESGAYEALTDDKYLSASDYLMRGDILLKNGHTVMVLSDGERVVREAAQETVSVQLPYLKKGSTGEAVEAVQRLLDTYGYRLGSRNPYDGSFGSMTDAAVREYQADNGLYIDGEVGAKTWAKLLGGEHGDGAD